MRKPLFYLLGHLVSTSISHRVFKFVWHCYWSSLFVNLCWFYENIVVLGTSSKFNGRHNRTQNRPSGANMLKNGSVPPPPASPYETLKHRETPSGLDLRVVMFFVVLRSPILVLQLLKMYVFSSFCGFAKYIEKQRTDRRFKIQWAPKWHTKATKWRQHGPTFNPYPFTSLRS